MEGDYRCRAVNDFGAEFSKAADLTVFGRFHEHYVLGPKAYTNSKVFLMLISIDKSLFLLRKEKRAIVSFLLPLQNILTAQFTFRSMGEMNHRLCDVVL